MTEERLRVIHSKGDAERDAEVDANLVYAQLYLGKAIESLRQAGLARDTAKTNYLEEAGHHQKIFEGYVGNAIRLDHKNTNALMLKGIGFLSLGWNPLGARQLFAKALREGSPNSYVAFMNVALAGAEENVEELVGGIMENKDRYGEFVQLTKAEKEIGKKNYGLGTELMEGLLARLDVPEGGDVGFSFHAIDRPSVSSVLVRLVDAYTGLGDVASIQRVAAKYGRYVPSPKPAPKAAAKKAGKKAGLKVVK